MKKVLTGICLLSLLGVPRARAEWYDDMKISGDFRYRFEHIDQEGQENRQRDRIRARIGAFPRVNNDLDAGIQLTTGEQKGDRTSPTSGNATLTDVFDKKDIFLDLAYIDYHPEQIRGLDLIAGKMKNPFICVNDYIWDSDVTPEGLGLKYHIGDPLELLVNGGYFWVFERTKGDDNKLFAGQGALKYKMDDDTYGMLGGSIYHYTDIEGANTADLNWQGASSAYGNSTRKVVSGSTTNVLYAEDYQELEPFIEFGFKAGLPVRLFASYVVNNQADEDNKGYSAGVRIGKAKDPRTFEIGYDYRYLEKDAALGALTDSDSWGGGTDGKGHKLSAKYQLMKNWQAGVNYFIDQKGLDNSLDYYRLQVDLMAKF